MGEVERLAEIALTARVRIHEVLLILGRQGTLPNEVHDKLMDACQMLERVGDRMSAESQP